MTGVEDLNLNIEAIFVQYYNKSLKEQSKGFKNPKSIEIRCCNKKSLINNGGEVVCKFCGQVSHYEMVNEEFIDYYKNLYRIRRKSKYQRKYHIKNVLYNKLLQNWIYLTVEETCKLFRIFENVAALFFRLYPLRERLIKFNFIFYKIFDEAKFKGLEPWQYKIFSVRLSKQAAKKYNEIWNNINYHLRFDKPVHLSVSLKSL